MSTLRGHDGLLILGGRLSGAPLVDGAVGAAGVTVTMDGSALVGVVAVGDVFVVDGDAINRTVSGTVRAASTNHVSNITFTPSATSGWSNNATVTFASNSVGELTRWSIDEVAIEEIEDTVKGDTSKTYKIGLPPVWTGSATVRLDYGDTKQAELLDMIATGSPDGTIATLMFMAEDETPGKLKSAYGAAVLRNFSAESPEGSSIASASFDFRGSGTLTMEWNV